MYTYDIANEFKSIIVFGCKTIFPLSDCTYGAYPLFVTVLHILIKEVVLVPLKVVQLLRSIELDK